MVDANTVTAAIQESASAAAQSLLLRMVSNFRDTLISILAFLAGLLKNTLSMFGITLTPTGYIIVAAFALAAILYSLHKMTWNVLKAIVIGIIFAFALSMLGIIE